MLAFPSGLRPISGGFAPAMKTLGGGQSLSGFEQVVSTLSDRWQASFVYAIRNSNDVLDLRRLVYAMRGRANSVLLPVNDGGRAPWRKDAYGRLVTPKLVRRPQLDGTQFADASGIADTLITARMASSLPAQVTAISIEVNSGVVPRSGYHFSIGTRLYVITEVLNGDGNTGWTLGIWPWLREAVAVNTPVNFTSPACEMRFASDGEGADVLKALNLLRFGTVTLNFDEVAS